MYYFQRRSLDGWYTVQEWERLSTMVLYLNNRHQISLVYNRTRYHLNKRSEYVFGYRNGVFQHRIIKYDPQMKKLIQTHPAFATLPEAQQVVAVSDDYLVWLDNMLSLAGKTTQETALLEIANNQHVNPIIKVIYSDIIKA